MQTTEHIIADHVASIGRQFARLQKSVLLLHLVEEAVNSIPAPFDKDNCYLNLDMLPPSDKYGAVNLYIPDCPEYTSTAKPLLMALAKKDFHLCRGTDHDEPEGYKFDNSTHKLKLWHRDPQAKRNGDLTIHISMTAEPGHACRRVVVGTKTIQQPVYNVLCGEELKNWEAAQAQAQKPSEVDNHG